jgi:hypothetical protein
MMTMKRDSISKIASLMGKRSWKARVGKFGLKKLQEHMRKVGKQATGRPRLPDDQVTPQALYQRERRAKLKAAKLAKRRKL